MAKRGEPFFLVYADQAVRHLKKIDAKYYSLIRSTIEEQLEYEPDVQTRNRKPLRQPFAFAADWELRLGPDNRLRVFYQIDSENRAVHVVAIGVKDSDRLYVGNEEIQR